MGSVARNPYARAAAVVWSPRPQGRADLEGAKRMKIGGTPPIRGVGSVGDRRGPKKPDEGGRVDGREISDTTSIMGIPEEELTPKVRAAIMALMDEVARMRREMDTTQARIRHLERMADQDSLVPVFNRRAFVRELSRVLSYSERYGAPGSVIYFDINSFKEINDTYGHAAGDAALELVAESLIQNVRESDIVGRLGGDEFGVILSHADSATAAEKAQLLADSIRGSTFRWEGQAIDLDVAYGIYSFIQGQDARAALEAADKAMYAHKGSMKGGA